MSVGSCSGGATSPLKQLQEDLASRASGKVKPADQQAVSAALASIESNLSSGASSSAKDARPNPADVKAKVEGLVDDQVKSGALTSDQASQLKAILANATPKGAGGHGGPRGTGGRPPDPPPGDAAQEASSTSASASSTPDLLADFLKQLQAQLQTGYDGTGASRSASTSSRVVDYQA